MKGSTSLRRCIDNLHYPLHASIFNYNFTEVERLLREGNYDIEQKNIEGFTPLHIAIITANNAAITLLLKYNASPNSEDLQQRMPLHHACILGSA